MLEIDAASNTGVDNIRELRDMAQYSPSEGSSRVFIIDEVHMLSKGAFNALLKILEEPPARVFFFFATTEPNKIPRTILSRCQRFDFRLLSRDELAGAADRDRRGRRRDPGGDRPAPAGVPGRGQRAGRPESAGPGDRRLRTGSSTRTAVVAAFGLVRSELFLELNEAIIARDPARALRLVDDLAGSGQSLDAFARGVVTNFRNLMLLKIDPELAAMVDLPPDQVETLTGQADAFPGAGSAGPDRPGRAGISNGSTAAPSRASCWRLRWWSTAASNPGCCCRTWPGGWKPCGGQGHAVRPVGTGRRRRGSGIRPDHPARRPPRPAPPLSGRQGRVRPAGPPVRRPPRSDGRRCRRARLDRPDRPADEAESPPGILPDERAAQHWTRTAAA